MAGFHVLQKNSVTIPLIWMGTGYKKYTSMIDLHLVEARTGEFIKNV